MSVNNNLVNPTSSIQPLEQEPVSAPAQPPSRAGKFALGVTLQAVKATVAGFLWYKYDRYMLFNLGGELVKDYIAPLAVISVAQTTIIHLADGIAMAIIGPRPDNNDAETCSNRLRKFSWTAILFVENTAAKVDEKASRLFGIHPLKEMKDIPDHEIRILEIYRSVIIEFVPKKAVDLVTTYFGMRLVSKINTSFMPELFKSQKLDQGVASLVLDFRTMPRSFLASIGGVSFGLLSFICARSVTLLALEALFELYMASDAAIRKRTQAIEENIEKLEKENAAKETANEEKQPEPADVPNGPKTYKEALEGLAPSEPSPKTYKEVLVGANG